MKTIKIKGKYINIQGGEGKK